MSSPELKDSSEKDLESASSSRSDAGLPQLDTIPINRQSGMSFRLSRQDHRTLERTNSVSFLNGPALIPARAKIPGDFRTLSISVTETQNGRTGLKGSKGVADLASLEWHSLSVDEVCRRLGVDATVGLDAPMAKRRLDKNGPNTISKPKSNLPRKIFFYIFGGFGSLLFAASVVCFIAWRPLGDPAPQASNLALAVILLLVIALQAGFNAWQDYSTGRVMASISGMLPSAVLVIRDGNTFEIPAADLVSGDIIKIILGAKVPADVRIIESSSLRFDRSILTGESAAVSATVDSTEPNFMEARNIALQGTLCTDGSGRGICVALGDSTVFGRIAKSATRERPARTSLEVEIGRFVLIIASLAAATALFIVILWAAWLRTSHPDFINVSNLLIDIVSIAVAFIPEGLPVCVTLSLTVIASSMKKKNILCKSLATVESLGCVDVICSDKTGTLTQNRMSVVNVALVESTLTSLQVLSATQGSLESEALKVLVAIAGICNDAEFEKGEEEGEKRKANGDATDTGLLRFSESVASVDKARSDWKEVGKLAFNSKNKFALKLVKPTASSAVAPLSTSESFHESDHLLLIKGAPDILLRRCSHYLRLDGTSVLLDESSIASITATQISFASQGQRVLLLAKKVIPASSISKETFSDPSALEDVLIGLNTAIVFVGLVALVDPPRDDTAETVRICRRAGIRFMMVTGDFALTAAAIGAQVGIFTNPIEKIHHVSDLDRDMALQDVPAYDPDKAEGTPSTSLVLSGSELITMNDSQWKQVLAYDELVFARTSPSQKLQIVRAYQASGSTVCVTGDGVNDASALKQADVGVAVAGGSEVAIEAADLVLLDAFSAIVGGIEAGRLAFENLKKSILYLLPAGSFSELMPVLVNILFGVPQVLSNIQMILICVVTDVLPALSMVYEKPEADLLLRKPRNRQKDRLADGKLLCHAYFFLGILETLTSMSSAFYFGFVRQGIPFSALWLQYGNYDVDPDLIASATTHAQSIYFFNLVIMQFFNLLATRTRRLSLFQQNPLGGEKTRNLYIFPAMVAALSFAVFFSYIPVFQNVFGTTGVAVEFYFLPVAYGIILLFIDEMRKYWNRGHPSSLLARVAW